MALISKNFILDTQSKSVSVVPIVVLGELTSAKDKYVVQDIFSTSDFEVKDNDGLSYNTKGILKTISSIKNSIDVEDGRLKVNTFRFSIYNYYDILTPLTSSSKYSITDTSNPQASLIGKNIILYYKTQTTSKIDVRYQISEIGDEYHSIMFSGVISRVTQNKDIITIQGEDSTQDLIRDQYVPKMKQSDLPISITNNMDNYNKDDPIPMVFGMVDKSPAIVYKTKFSATSGAATMGAVAFIHDSREVYSTFTTKQMFNDFEISPHIYIEDGGDYLIFPYKTDFLGFSGKTLFIEGYSTGGAITNEIAIFPELESESSTSIYCFGYAYAVNAISDLSGDVTLESLSGVVSSDISINPDYEPLLLNYNVEKKWYRDGEITNIITDQESFDFGTITYPTSTPEGNGRWVLFTLDKKEVLLGWRGYSKIYADNQTTNNNSSHVRLRFKPFNTDQFKDYFESDYPPNKWVYGLLGDDVDGSTNPELNFPNDQPFPRVGEGTQYLHWYSNSNNDITDTKNRIDFLTDGASQAGTEGYTDCSGNYIGDEPLLAQNVAKKYNESIPCDRILIWEHYIPADNPAAVTLGAKMHSFGAKYIKQIDDFTKRKYYASITGRKDFLSTENVLDLESLLAELGTSYNDSLLGEDGVSPDYDGVVDAWDDYFRNKYTFEFSTEYTERWADEIASSGTHFNHGFLGINHMLANYDKEMLFPDYGVIKNSYYNSVVDIGEEWLDLGGDYVIPDFEGLGLDDSPFMKSHQITSIVLHGMMKKFYFNILIYWANVWGWARGTEDQDFFTIGANMWLEHPSQGQIAGAAHTPNSAFWWYSIHLFYMGMPGAHDPFVFYQTAQNKLNEYNDLRRQIIRRILQYIYQNPLSTETSIDTTLQDNFGGSNFTYDYNEPALDIIGDDGNVNIESWAYNMSAYMDDTIYTVNTSEGLKIENAIPPVDYNGNDHTEHINFYTAHTMTLNFFYDDPLVIGQEDVIEAMGITLAGGFNGVSLHPHINSTSVGTENFSDVETNFSTLGIVDKPIDILINILSRELDYGMENGLLNTNVYRQETIQKARDFYSGWKMGFCIDEEILAYDLLINLFKETQSLFSFTPDGGFDLITIKNSYTADDTDYTLDSDDIYKYSITRTRREDIITSTKYYYRYDNGLKNYTFDTGVLDITTLLPQYDGVNYYNLQGRTGYLEKNLRYHTDTNTAKLFQKYELYNKCNQHLIIKMDVSLKLAKIKVGQIIHIPLLDNNKAFGIDYSKVQVLNNQHIYPLWVVTEVDIKENNVSMKAYQLHYLSNDGSHGYVDPVTEEPYVIFANISNPEHSSLVDSNGNSVLNWNYLPEELRIAGETYHESGIEIPYGDENHDTMLNVVDIVSMVQTVLNDEYNEIQDMTNDGSVNVIDITKLVGIVLGGS